MKTVVIHGRGKSTFAYNGEAEHWGLGVDTSGMKFDRVFELHGLSSTATDTKVSDKILKLGLPLANSMCIMVVTAWVEGFAHIVIQNSPLAIKEEYISQARALSYICGYLAAKGLTIEWLDSRIEFDKVYPNMKDS